MNDQILLRFLTAGLINVGGDDAKLERLNETASDLTLILKRSPSRTASFALAAFDPQLPVGDPVVREVVDALTKRWPTHVNTFSGTPITVVRALLLDALTRAASEDEKVGVAFVVSARNALPHMEAGNERAIWTGIVSDLEHKVDARAEADWATPETITVAGMHFTPPKAMEVGMPQVQIDRASLTKRFEAAAGPQSRGTPTQGNPHWPHSDPTSWVPEFGKRMADTVADALQSTVKGLRIEPIDLAEPLKDLAQAVAAHVDETLQSVSRATAGLQRRTNLIWWKQSLYSPSAQTSYRSLKPSAAAALMAFDLYKQVPTFSPASVASFLHEAVIGLPSVDASARQTISDCVKEAVETDVLIGLRNVAEQLIPDSTGRGPVLAIIANKKNLSLEDPQFRALTAIPADTQLTVAEWAVWLFRELQAARATQEEPEQKKRSRKT